MDLTIFQQVLLYAFLIAAVMGALVNKTNFCTMGAVSDWVNMGDTGRFRAWVFAMALAIGGVLVMQAGGILDARLAVSSDSAFPPYRTAMFAWPRYLLGGLLFGIGMTLASGCGNKTLVRIGGGNLKSVLVLLVMGGAAYLMMFTDFMAKVFLPWMQPLFLNLGDMGIGSQGLGDLVGGALGMENTLTVRYVLGGLLALGLAVWALRSADFRGRFDNLLGGIAVGLAILGGWYVSAGPMGRAWVEEAEFADTPPLHVAAQSYTFVSPTGDLYNWLMRGMADHLVSFGMAAALGVIVGSFLYAVLSRSFRIEWFSSLKDFVNHLVGGALMGIGGVLGMGCTIGQGVTGTSTLALGSFMTFGAIALGSALTMKVQYYKMLYEAEASFGAALVTALVDLRLLPKGMRRLEAM